MKTATISAGRPIVTGNAFLRTWRALRSSETPLWKKAAFAAALAYLVLPVDAVPDVVPIVGWLDDAGMLLLAVSQLLRQERGPQGNS